MTTLDIPYIRLHTQRIAGTPFKRPEDAVTWLDAVQAQDYAGAKWALGLRTEGATDADIDRAFNDGTILRTHVLRPTWHFVMPADIRWMLELTSPRVHSFNAYYYRKLQLDDATFARSDEVLAKALEGGKYLTRTELASALKQAGIDTQELLRVGLMIMHAELEGVICSGPRRGKQFTYALLEERAPTAIKLGRNEALGELSRRYFVAHGPATVQDYKWWSGLSAADAKAGLEMVRPQLMSEVVDDRTYWYAEGKPYTKGSSPTAYLLPNYDDYSIGYTNHDATFEASQVESHDRATSLIFAHTIVIDGQIVGSWKRIFGKGSVVITLKPFKLLSDAESRAVGAAADKYGEFLGMPVVLAEG
ncbi:MAG: winged helix DNA-binding domain-containing protein [Chloroflexota bacterium]